MTTTPMKTQLLQEVSSDDRFTLFKLQDGASFAVPHAPHYPEVTEPAAIARKAINALGALDDARRKAASDPTLSELGRTKQVEPVLKAARDAMAQAKAEIQEFTASVEAFEAKTFAPPALESTDVVGAMVDLELRNWLRGLRSGKPYQDAMSSLPKEPRLLAAVVRSPTKLDGFSDAGSRYWRDHIASTHPDAPKVGQHREALTWARELLANIETFTR